MPGPIRTQWDVGAPWAPERAATWGEMVSDRADTAVIHQLANRSWSTSVPLRAAADGRIEFRGWDDPADPTNGVDGAENITDLDVWLDLNQFGIDPPWGA